MTKPSNLYAWTDSTASPQTVYTDSTNLNVGTVLYNNSGIDTGEMVGGINQNGSFDIGDFSVTFAIGSYVTNYVLDGITYNSGKILKLSEGTHSLVINGDYTSLYIESNGSLVKDGVVNTGTYNGSLTISSGIIKEMTKNYQFGYSPITLTFSGSLYSGGGSIN